MPSRLDKRNFTAPCPNAHGVFWRNAQAKWHPKPCARKLNNLERSRLLHILLFAADLMNQVRRSGRIPRLVPVRLINGPHSDTWIEDTVTQDLSKHGAMLRCTHPCAEGETLGLVRLDTGDRAIARVVWRERDKFAQHKVAVEILNCSNFWNWRVEAGGQP